jgi:uncharacterized membrane protein YfcA
MILALLGALAIGVSLGLLGSGGSIITVPILVFILQRPEKIAICESLAIVGSVALVGAIPYMFRRQIEWKSVLFFGLPGMLGACLGGCGCYYVTGTLQLILFALVMLIVASIMLSNRSIFEKATFARQSIWVTVLEGFLVGCLTGLIGVGGGFLIVPSLVLLGNLSMTFAIGTSLVIIAMNALTGFIQQFFILKALHLSIDWKIIVIVTIVGILGSLTGGVVGNRIPQMYLRKAFGLSILAMGSYILIKHLF